MRTNRLLPLLAAGALVLGACGGGGESVDTGGGGGGGDDVLAAAVSAQPDQFDPHSTNAYASFQVLENVYDTLVVPNPEDLTMEPSLATEWATSEDDLTWTFTLREGVTFHDGSEFDSADVVYSYNRIIDEDLSNAYRFANVESVAADGPQTVVITLTQPTPNLLERIGAFKGMSIIPEGAADELDLTTEAIGTGPFRLESSDASSTVLTAYEDYWGGAPSIDGVEFRYITEPAAALTALQNGEVQWTDNIPPQQIESLQGDDTVELQTTPSVDSWYMSMNYARPPFDNRDVRRAISFAVDREAVAEAAWFGAAQPNQTAIPQDSFFHSDYAPFSPDPDQARQLLQQAGVQTPLTMGLMVTDEYPETVTAAQVVAGQLEQVGITVEIETLDFATWLDRQGKGDYDAFLLGWLGNLDPAAYYEEQHKTGGSNNYQGYSNPQVDQLLAAGAAETDPDARKAIYDQAAQLIVDDVSYLYLYNPDVVQAWAPGLSGYQIRADKAINFETVELP
ncbi:ABC transporter substrate-binding protein [Geodermatophilus sabuli]|uniref:Peptide/nickel transport system substrate-binding protein n=1 Tax=Geodermatophilus sabuli TaxID=1564158 RepID=A0A285EI51_9ACTN|nr:ABC transporter substrate-binding protein [Geodermatophilus sabuli]MBB3086818.1 peptide/nickel transport system substrate-binding protein [Geodermatophilus sabuli]SNX98808.1 peptide/nickel transport system substrate-binding protein [Geodermatophilus sabuli]